MSAIAPLICLLLLFLALRNKEKKIGLSECWRSSFLSASVLWVFLLTAATELLSLFNLIRFGWVLGFWVLATAASALFYLSSIKTANKSTLPETPKFSPAYILLLSGVVIIIITIGMISLLCPPNNWDSMVYHSPKVVHWIQNHNINFYPTHVLRQNHQNPGAEYVIMHFQILSRTDLFSNLVQWYAMVGCVIGASLIAKQLRVNKLGQVFACVFTATFPMGIMQASSTQTDYIAAFWIVCFAHYVLRLRVAEKVNWPCYLGVGLSLGLAILAKATAYIYAPFFLLWLVLSQLKLFRAKALVPLCTAALFVIAINAGHLLRNYDLYGHPLGPMDEGTRGLKYSNDIYTPRAFASNILRNIGTHTVTTPVMAVNNVAYKSVSYLHKTLGIDQNDPRTTWAGTQFIIQKHAFVDEVGGNPVHLLLTFLSYISILIFGKLRKSGDIVKYSLAVLAVFLLLCFYLRWGPWHSRIHTGLFVLWAPVVAVTFSTIINRKVLHAFAVILLLLAVPWLLWCVQKPLIGDGNIFITSRNELYFGTPSIRIKHPYLNAKEYLKYNQLSQVGLIVAPEVWEYPMLMLLHQDNPNIHFQHINVTNVSSKIYDVLPYSNFQADAVIAIKMAGAKEPASTNEVTVDGQVFTRQWLEGPVAIYFKE